jgi:hypothetical protein
VDTAAVNCAAVLHVFDFLIAEHDHGRECPHRCGGTAVTIVRYSRYNREQSHVPPAECVHK